MPEITKKERGRDGWISDWIWSRSWRKRQQVATDCSRWATLSLSRSNLQLSTTNTHFLCQIKSTLMHVCRKEQMTQKRPIKVFVLLQTSWDQQHLSSHERQVKVTSWTLDWISVADVCQSEVEKGCALLFENYWAAIKSFCWTHQKQQQQHLLLKCFSLMKLVAESKKVKLK